MHSHIFQKLKSGFNLTLAHSPNASKNLGGRVKLKSRSPTWRVHMSVHFRTKRLNILYRVRYSKNQCRVELAMSIRTTMAFWLILKLAEVIRIN